VSESPAPVELELKAVVADPDAVRRSLAAAGARLEFRGRMEDLRYDRDGELTRRDEVLRLRTYRPYEAQNPGDSRYSARLAWKGPTRRSPDGYKARAEIEVGLSDPGGPELLGSVGFRTVQIIDRYVEVYRLQQAMIRLEWYPRMDVLIEIEGDARSIEAGILATGIPRSDFTAEPLVAFAARYQSRTGHPALLAVADLKGEEPPWPNR
jgi:adenylate cyclase class IV